MTVESIVGVRSPSYSRVRLQKETEFLFMSDCKPEQDQWFWTKSQRKAMILVFLRSKITKIDDVGEPPVPSQPKTMSETKYLDSKAFQEKVCI